MYKLIIFFTFFLSFGNTEDCLVLLRYLHLKMNRYDLLSGYDKIKMVYKTCAMIRTSLYDRVKKLLLSDEWSDCCFSLSGKCFRAHKLIMGISSPVFEAMFYGPLSKNENIVITDIEPEIFQLLLNYIYTDKVELNSVEEAFELLYASRKYMLEYLCEMCILYIKTNISMDNVIDILNYPDFMQEKELVSTSLKLLCEHANHLLQENKEIISPYCMRRLLSSNQINTNEISLIKHVFDWTERYCDRNNLSKSFENKRQVLVKNGLFKLMRFFTLSEKELDSLINDATNLLSPKEIKCINNVIMHGSTKCVEPDMGDTLCFSLSPRKPLAVKWYFCHRSPLRSAAPVIIDSDHNTIYTRVKAHKSVFITSLCIPTRMAPILNFSNNDTMMYSEQISVSLRCETDNSLVKSTNFMNTVEYDSVINIELSEPCLLQKDKWYRVSFVWPLNIYLTYAYVVEYRDRVYKDHKILFEFDDITSSGCGGSFLGGLKFCL